MEPDEGGSRSSSSRGVDRPVRVIELDRCAGVQVGRENDQFSAYRVTLPRAAFRSPEALAETLLSRDAPWSRDRFIHDACPDPRSVAGRGYRSTSSGIIEDPRGDTLVIVRDSRGVQIGDRNRQRNEFRIRVSDTAVHADKVGMTRERERYISRLCEDPRDRTAARRLAEDLERAARTELMADLTARVRHLIGKPEVSRWSGKFRNLVGRQIGGPRNRARVQVHVRVSKFDTHALERHLRETAARLPRLRTPDPGIQHSGREMRRIGRDPPSTGREMRRIGDGRRRAIRPGRGFR
jgi:RIP homotypic interaction motif